VTKADISRLKAAKMKKKRDIEKSGKEKERESKVKCLGKQTNK
jgi:hypothetical protein